VSLTLSFGKLISPFTETKCGGIPDCVVDVGNIHDPGRLLFDHKLPTCAERAETCADKIVWRHLIGLGKPTPKGKWESSPQTVTTSNGGQRAQRKENKRQRSVTQSSRNSNSTPK
jgi:hypothetical protein